MKVYTLQTSAETIDDFFSEQHYLADISVNASTNSFTITRANGDEITFTAIADNQKIKVGDVEFGPNTSVKLQPGTNISLSTDTTDSANPKITFNSSYTNQTISAAGTTFSADATITLAAGNNISIAANATTKTITIGSNIDAVFTIDSFENGVLVLR